MSLLEGPSALIVAHPGHELRLTAWLARARPSVHVLTTGSRHGQSRARIDACRELVLGSGASTGDVFGWFEDRQLYAALMAGEIGTFDDTLWSLVDDLVARGAKLVICDAWQLYSPAHDLVHLLARSAAAIAQRILGHKIAVLEFGVVAPGQSLVDAEARERRRITLSSEEKLRKLLYVSRYPDIEQEAAEFLQGDQSLLAVERFDSPLDWADLAPAPGVIPLYEKFGEERVAAGHYKTVLRWSHVAPFVEALRHRAKARTLETRRSRALQAVSQESVSAGSSALRRYRGG